MSGKVKVKVTIRNPADPNLSKELELEVESLAPCTILPGALLRGLGVRGRRKEVLKFIDGRVLERYTGRVIVEFDGRATKAKVAFGRRGDPQLLDAAVLEELGFYIDPRTGEVRRLWMPLI